MRRLYFVLIALLLCFAMFGCAVQTSADAPSQTPPVGTAAESEQPNAQQTEPAEKKEYAQLDAFIALINSFSDAPQLDSDEEYDAYYKDLFDQWKAGKAFANIIEDASGNLLIDDHSAEFSGSWIDSTSQRAVMDIQSDGVYYNIEINWGSSAFENTKWLFTGMYDAARGGIVYASGQRIEEVYTAEGVDPKQTFVYEDGTGFFEWKDGKIYWTDEKENMGAEMVFEKDA